MLARHGVKDVRVFGSVARGDDEPDSDIDLLVELQGERSSGGELLEVLELSELLSALVGAGGRRYRTLPTLEVRDLALAEAVPL